MKFCDICELPLKKGWVMGVKKQGDEQAELEVAQSIQEFYDNMLKSRSRRDQAEVYEICDGCKKVWDSFFALRRLQVKNIKKELDKLDT